MSRLRGPKVLRVTRRELWTTITRPGFILSTAALPLLPLLIVFMTGLVDPQKLLAGEEPARVGVVDLSGTLDPDVVQAPPPPPPFEDAEPEPAASALDRLAPGARDLADRVVPKDSYVVYDSAEAARADLLSGELTGYVVVPEGWLESRRIESFRLRAESGPGPLRPFGLRLGTVLRRALLEGRVDPQVARVALEPVAREEHVLDARGEEVAEEGVAADVRRFVVPVLFAVFLMVALFAGAGYLLLGLSEEKENRILEILLSSLSPGELLAGKLLGIGAAGLLQFSIWVGVVAIPAALAAPFLGIRLDQVAWAMLFFLGGYALYGALMLGVGAVADTARHAQQLSGLFTLVAMAPLLFNFLILQEPHGALSRFLSLFPLTSPIAMMLRMASDMPPLWELLAAVALLAAAGVGALWLAARVFRVALLLRGKTPSPVEIWRALRAAG